MTANRRWRLGLDIGSNSVGWAGLAIDQNGDPMALIGLGARVFPPGVEGDLEAGKEESRSVARRQKRLLRRQLARRARRQRKTYNALRTAGLLPGDPASSVICDQALKALDKQLRADFVPVGDHRKAQLLPYLIRAAALDRPLAPHALGRALYHLAQRRGFQSNRKESAKKETDKETSEVKASIATLGAEIIASGARTLGEFLSQQDPDQKRVRRRWTARAMYEAEFEAIRNAQAPHHPAVTRPQWQAIRDAIFYQRPLKSQRGKVGRCEFIPEEVRAPRWLPEFQRFRILQAVNHLRVRTEVAQGAALTLATRRGYTERSLTPAERGVALEMLATQGVVTLTSLRNRLKLKGTTFGIEAGGEKQLMGDTTAARMRSVFGDRWDTMSRVDRDRAINDVMSFERETALERRARRHWGLDAEQAKKLSTLRLEEGYATLGREALSAMLPFMEKGKAVQEARKEAFPNHFEKSDQSARLEPVRRALNHLRNPTVERCLTETRRVVNELVRLYGVPDSIVVELARDIKRSKKDRQEMSKQNRSREGERDQAREKLDRHKIANPTRADIERALLHEECGGRCPYTGRHIAFSDLFGRESQWDIEHIIPFSRSLDDSFGNKTLCWADENRDRKRNRTPHEAYSKAPKDYEAMLERVAKFQGKHARRKLSLFRLEDAGDSLCEEFSGRQLNDTRYASRLAGAYLGELYGGIADSAGRQRVFSSTGQATAHVRRLLGLEGMLHPAGAPIKNRQDHRHHAVDAVAIALTTPSMVKALADCAERGAKSRAKAHRIFGSLESPFPDFSAQVQTMIGEIVVSHRGDRRVVGPMHEETNYSPPIGGDAQRRHVRKPIAMLSKKDLGEIVDPVVREAVAVKLKALGGDPKAFENPGNLPFLTAKNGRKIPIKKVRLEASRGSLIAVGRNERVRHVAPGSNHHLSIVAVLGADGKTKQWEGHVVTRAEAMRRVSAKEPVVQREWGRDRKFCFTVASGDTVEIEHEGKRVLALVRGVSGQQLEFQLAVDARAVTDIRKVPGARDGLEPTANAAMLRGMRRVMVSPTGALTYCNA